MFYQRKWWHAWNLADLIVSCVLNLYAFNIFLLFSSSSIIKFSPKIINLVDVLCHIMIFKRTLCCYPYSVTDETQITNFLVSGISKINSFLLLSSHFYNNFKISSIIKKIKSRPENQTIIYISGPNFFFKQIKSF